MARAVETAVHGLDLGDADLERDVRPARFTVVAVAASVVGLPVLIPRLPGNAALVDLVVLVAIVAAVIWAAGARATVHMPYVVPLWIVLIAGSVAMLFGSYPGAGSQAIVQTVFLLAWGGAIATVLRTPDALATVVSVWSYSAVGWAGVLVLATLTGQAAIAGIDTAEGARAALTFGDQNGAAAYFVISLVIVLGSDRPRRGVARWGAIALLAFAVVLTGSLAGIVSLPVVAVAGIFAGSWRRWGLVPAIAITLVLAIPGAGALWFATASDLVDRAAVSEFTVVRDSLGRGRQSAGTRAVLARETADLIRTGPPIGRGPASTLPSLEASQAPYPKEAHNDFVAALVELGVVGMFGVLLLFIDIVWRAISVGGRTASRAVARSMPRAHLLLAASPAFVIFAMTHEILHDRAFWTFLGVIAALHIWSSDGLEARGSA